MRERDFYLALEKPDIPLGRRKPLSSNDFLLPLLLFPKVCLIVAIVTQLPVGEKYQGPSLLCKILARSADGAGGSVSANVSLQRQLVQYLDI